MIFVTGDCHGDYHRFAASNFPEQKYMDREDYVIVCGDFGLWDESREQRYWLDWLEELDFTLLWVDGNHENYDLLKTYPVVYWKGGDVQMIRSNIIHLKRGQMFSLQGSSFFTFGGARSHDVTDGILEPGTRDFKQRKKALEGVGAHFRINHISWWREEMPSEKEYRAGLEIMEGCGWNCDYIITHCAPTSIQDYFSYGRFEADELTDYLEAVKKQCQYKKWFFGHYHDNEMFDDKHQLLYQNIQRVV